MSLRLQRALTLLLVGIGAFVFSLAPSGAATSAALPSISSFTSSVTTLRPEGGPVSLSASVVDADTCTFSVVPALAGFPASVPCSSPVAGTARGIIVKQPGSGNPSGRALKYVFSLTVTNSAGTVESSVHPSFVQASYRWNVSSRPLGLSAPPQAVSCGAPTFCMVVGAQGRVATFTDAVVSRRFTTDHGHALTDVSCAGSVCVVLDRAGNYLLWRGGKMSGENPFYDSSGRRATLTSVSCSSPTFCMAVGDAGAAASFNAAGLTDRTAAGHAWNNAPRRVSCASSHLCVVVTDRGDAFAWDGSAWTSLGLVDPGGDVTGLSCAADGTCTIADGSGPAVTIKVSGTFSFGAPSVEPPVDARAVTCSTPSYCLALDGSGGAEQKVALVWSPRSNLRGSPPVVVSCSRGFTTPVGALCVAVSGDGQVEYTGNIVRAVTPTCQATPHVGPVGMTVTPADASDGFVYATGQFFEGDTVGLDVSASSSCGLAPKLSYSWALASRPGGSSAALSSPSSPTPSFVADVVGTYQVSLVVQDSLGNRSAPAVLTISTGSCGANRPAVSLAAAPAAPMDPHSLVATASSDDNDAAKCPSRFRQTYSYAWSVVSGPSGGKFSDSSVANPTFTADVPGGTYVLKAVATGQKSGLSGSAQTTIDSRCAVPATNPSISAVNGAPYGGEQVITGDDVTLGANATSACFSSPSFTFAWSLLSPPGSSASLSSATDAAPTFTPDVAGTYQARLVVTDSTGRSSPPAVVTVTTSDCGAAPVVGPVQVTVTPADSADGFVYAPAQVFRDDTVSLNASASSSCRLGKTLTYSWTLTAQPPGSTATLSSPTSPTPSFVPDVVGTYQVSVVVQDSLGNASAPVSTTLTTETCGANVPTVSIAVTPAMPMDPHPLSATALSKDDDASVCPSRFASQKYSYAWSVVSGPGGGGGGGSSGGFSDASAPSPTFTPDVPGGTYLLKVVATGQKSGLSSSAQTTIDSSCAAPATSPSITELNGQPLGGDVILTGDNVKLDAGTTAACATSQTFTYQWHLSQTPPGSSAVLSSSTDATPSFTPDVAGTYTVSVIATDAWGRSSSIQSFSFDAATCSVAAQVGTVTPAGGAGGFVYSPGQLFEGDTVGLDASPSSSCRSTPGQALTYAWKMISQPAGSSAALNNPSSQNPSFVPDVVGSYRLRVHATDSRGGTSDGELTVSTGSCGANPPVVDITVAPSMPMDPHSLTATASSDDDDPSYCPARFSQTYSFAWSVVSGPGGGGGGGGGGGSGGFSDATVANPTFTPDVPGGTYVLEVVATGQKSGLSASAQTTIDSSCGAPVISKISITHLNDAPYGGEQVLAGDDVTLGATATSACLSTPQFTYAWQLLSPPGSSAALSSPTDAAPTFTADVAGTYQVRLVVTDSTGRASAPAVVTISTSDCGAAPVVGSVQLTVTPVDGADAFVYSPGQFFEGDTVGLDVSASSSCRAAQTLTYAWTLTAPVGSSASLNDPSSSTPSFVADVVGTYQVSVVVQDSLGNASPPAFRTLTSGTCGANPVSVSIADTAPSKPMDPHSLVATALSNDDGATCPTRFSNSYSFAWSVVSGPGGGAFSDASVSSPTFTPDVPGGTYLLEVVATGQKSGLSGSAQTTIDSSCAAPTISRVSITHVNDAPYGGQQVLAGDDVTLGATATSACVTAPTFTYAWHLLSPPGSSALLSSPTAAAPRFTPDVPGTYQLSLVVTDSTGLSSDPGALQVTAAPAGTSRAAILAAGQSTGDGTYWLRSGSGHAFQTYCDMTSAGGGWTALFAGPKGSTNVFDHFDATDYTGTSTGPATR